jgi:chemotaxis methyl-accepting protein methylase
MQRPNSSPLGEGLRPSPSALEYEVWRELIWQRCGLYFTESRIRFLSQRLRERMRLRRSKSYSEYYHYVAFNPEGEGEWEELLELLLNKETGFFRHLPSFEALTGHVLPRLMRDKQKYGVNTITLWSAGCSTGQEAYSLAMAFLERYLEPVKGPVLNTAEGMADSHLWQVKVTGSDISQRALDKARRGRYKPYEVRYMPALYRKNYLTVVEDAQNVFYQVGDRVRELVRFGNLNLSDPDSYWISAQDVIFCQNVLIYFKPESRIEIVRRLCQRLNPGGYLFLAPAEVVGLKLPGVQPVRLPDSLIYQRVR